MKSKIYWIIGLVILIIIGFMVFNKSEDSGTIKIGYIGPMTGPSAVLGMDAVTAIQIAVKEVNDKGGINGKPIEVIFEDDKYLTKDTVNAYSKLVNVDKAKIVLVATYGGVYAIADQAKQDGVIVIDPLDCNSEIAGLNENIFCLATDTESIGVSLANYLVKSGKTTAAIMYSTKDSFMNLVATAFSNTLKAQGGDVVATEEFNYDDSDFRTQLAKIKLANPGALVLLGHDETGVIMKQAREMGIWAPFLATGTITSPPLQQAAQGNAEGAFFAYWDADPNNAKAVDFTSRFMEMAKRPPILPLTTHPAYDTITVLAEKVLPNISGRITDDKIAEQLLSVRNYQGTTGLISFDADGGARIAESVYKLVQGAPVSVK